LLRCEQQPPSVPRREDVRHDSTSRPLDRQIYVEQDASRSVLTPDNASAASSVVPSQGVVASSGHVPTGNWQQQIVPQRDLQQAAWSPLGALSEGEQQGQADWTSRSEVYGSTSQYQPQRWPSSHPPNFTHYDSSSTTPNTLPSSHLRDSRRHQSGSQTFEIKQAEAFGYNRENVWVSNNQTDDQHPNSAALDPSSAFTSSVDNAWPSNENTLAQRPLDPDNLASQSHQTFIPTSQLYGVGPRSDEESEDNQWGRRQL